MVRKNLVKAVGLALVLFVFFSVNILAGQINTVNTPEVQSENYETGYNVGDTKNSASANPKGFGNFLANGSNPIKLTIAGDDSNKYLQIVDNNLTDTKQGRADLWMDYAVNGICEYEFDFRMPTYTMTATNVPFIGINTGDATSTVLAGGGNSGKTVTQINFKNVGGQMQLEIEDRTSFINQGGVLDAHCFEDRFDPLSFNTWYTMKIQVNLTTNSYTLSIYNIDGTLIVTDSQPMLTRAEKSDTNLVPSALSLIVKVGSSTASGQTNEMHFDNIVQTKDRFAVLNKPVITADAGIVTATVKVQNETPSAQTSPTLVLALFDENGKLIGMDSSSVSVDARLTTSRYQLTPAVDLTCQLSAGDASTAIAYIWTVVDGTNSLKPYTAQSDVFNITP